MAAHSRRLAEHGGRLRLLVPEPRRHPYRAQVMSGMISSATMFATLIIGLIAGPAVSL